MDHLTGSFQRHNLIISPDGGWSNTSAPANFVYDTKQGIRESREAVAPFSGLDDIAAATGPGGQAVAIGTMFDRSSGEGHWWATSLTRTGERGSWTPRSGLSYDGYTVASDIINANNVWYAAITAAPDGNYRNDFHARILRSTDGKNWTPMSGDWAKGNSGSDIFEMCVTSDGRPLAVGTVDAPDRKLTHAATWRLEGSTWKITTHVDPAKSSSGFGSCASTKAGTVISGHTGGREATWTTREGKTLSAPTFVAENESRDSAETIGNVVLAGGSIDRHNNTGPVVWVSDNGTSWRAVPLPEGSGAESVSVYTVSDGAIAVADTGNGTKAWRLTGLPATSAKPKPSVSSSS